MKVAIVTTLIDAEQVIESFIDYHLKIGFDHLYLFFDNPGDSTISSIRKKKNISIIPCDKMLKEKWLATNAYAAYSHLRSFINSEPMARQMLNMEVACQLAKQDDIRWILHIDIDELFYSPHASVREHFQALEAANAIFYRYLNYEAVPEKEDIDNYFKEVTLFKKNPNRYSAMEEINHQKYVGRELFHYYKNGKMAARVDSIFLPGIHEFVFSRDGIGKTFSLEPSAQTDPAILHYPCCGFNFFYQKYKRLGNFNENIFGRQLFESYKKSKRVIQQHDETLAKEFYRQSIMLSEEEIQRLLSWNLLERIEQPAHLLLDSN